MNVKGKAKRNEGFVNWNGNKKNIQSSIYTLQTQNLKMQTSLHNPIIASKPPHL
jgi:hypothetical protein